MRDLVPKIFINTRSSIFPYSLMGSLEDLDLLVRKRTRQFYRVLYGFVFGSLAVSRVEVPGALVSLILELAPVFSLASSATRTILDTYGT